MSFFRRRSVPTASVADKLPPPQRIHETTAHEDRLQDKTVSLWPPPMSQASLEHLINAATDWQLLHGSIVKQPVTRAFVSQRLAGSTPMSVSLIPAPFPRRLFEQAVSMQNVWSELLAKVCCDRSWLEEATRKLRKVDAFARLLWEIAEESEKHRLEILSRRGESDSEEVLEMAFWRSDYMIQESSTVPLIKADESMCLKQVGVGAVDWLGIQSNNVSDMHRHFERIGLYRQLVEPEQGSSVIPSIESDRLPVSDVLSSVVKALSDAHRMYSERRQHVTSSEAGPVGSMQIRTRTCVLMVVQPFSSNAAGERPTEYQLWKLNPPVPCFRVSLGQETQERTRLLEDGQLLFSPPGSRDDPFEVAVVFYRAGHEEREYLDVDSFDWAESKPRRASTSTTPSIRSRAAQCRILLEASNAIKCPPVLGHVATSRSVQAALSAKAALDRLLPNEPVKQKLMRETWVEMLAANDEHASGVLTDLHRAEGFVLRPSLGGSGDGTVGPDIVNFAKTVPRDALSRYVLCQKLKSPPMQALLMSSRGLYRGAVTCELQTYGSCFWRRKQFSIAEDLNSTDSGWTLKTKSADGEAKSTLNTYDALDSPLLVSDEAFGVLSKLKQTDASPAQNETLRSFSTAF